MESSASEYSDDELVLNHDIKANTSFDSSPILERHNDSTDEKPPILEKEDGPSEPQPVKSASEISTSNDKQAVKPETAIPSLTKPIKLNIKIAPFESMKPPEISPGMDHLCAKCKLQTTNNNEKLVFRFLHLIL